MARRFFAGLLYKGRQWFGRLFGVAGAVVTDTTFGGIWHRALWSWARLFKRKTRFWTRLYRRGLSWDRLWGRNKAEWRRTYHRTWDRLWRWTVPNTFPAEVLTKPVSEDRDYGFDFSDSPEVQGGATLSSAVVVSPPAGLTFGSVRVNEIFDGIAVGKVAIVEISGGTDDNTYSFAMKGTLSTGRKLVIPARLVVVGDAE